MVALRPTHVVGYNALLARKQWLSALFVSLISPLLFLGAMGLGLGGLVRGSRHTVDGVSYLVFLAPGLLATTAMQTAQSETTFPIMGRLMWNRTYEAMLNTPMGYGDVLVGEMVWLTVRLALTSVVFLAVAAAMGAVKNPAALLGIPVATATGLAFGAPIFALSATLRTDNGFAALNRFVVIPLFLLGGAFFPVTQLPRVLQGIAWSTPLCHGVQLCRDLFLGHAGMTSALAHLTVVALYIAAGIAVAAWRFRKRVVV